MRRLINFFDYIRTPAIKIKSRQCLEDIKTCFNIENDIRNRKGGYFELSIGTDFFNDLLLIYKESLGESVTNMFMKLNLKSREMS